MEEMMGKRGVAVDHSTLNRGVIKYAPEIEKQFRRRQYPVGRSWRMDETYVRIKGKWAYLYRAVLRSVSSKWRQARDEELRPKRSLITCAGHVQALGGWKSLRQPDGGEG
jgi:transposase-like protein